MGYIRKERGDYMYEVEIVPTETVAKILHTTPAKVTAMVINGTLPIGAAISAKEAGQNRAIIVKRRLEAWLNAKDLNGQDKPL